MNVLKSAVRHYATQRNAAVRVNGGIYVNGDGKKTDARHKDKRVIFRSREDYRKYKSAIMSCSDVTGY